MATYNFKFSMGSLVSYVLDDGSVCIGLIHGYDYFNRAFICVTEVDGNEVSFDRWVDVDKLKLITDGEVFE